MCLLIQPRAAWRSECPFTHTDRGALSTTTARTEPIIGLYSAAIGPFAYAFLGTSHHISVGPISMASLFIPVALASLGFDTADTSAGAKAERAEAAVVITFYIFVIFLVLAVLRLGTLIRFISHSVMTGFGALLFVVGE